MQQIKLKVQTELVGKKIMNLDKARILRIEKDLVVELGLVN